MKIAIGSDHHGIQARKKLCEWINSIGHEAIDHGPDSPDSPVDYPDVAAEVARMVSRQEAERGILLCGTGIGMCIVANKFPGVRAATVMDELTAEISRRHNDLNILCLSGDVLVESTIERLVQRWLETPFDGGRHARRIDKISQIEKSVD